MDIDILELLIALFEDEYGKLEDFEEESCLENLLFDIYGIDVDDFEKLIKALIPLCVVSTSEFSGKKYKGFGKNGIWLCKMLVK